MLARNRWGARLASRALAFLWAAIGVFLLSPFSSYGGEPGCPPTTVEVSRNSESRVLDCARITELTLLQIRRLTPDAVRKLSATDRTAVRHRQAVLEIAARESSRGAFGSDVPGGGAGGRRIPLLPSGALALTASAALAWLIWRNLLGGRLAAEAGRELETALNAICLLILAVDVWVLVAAPWGLWTRFRVTARTPPSQQFRGAVERGATTFDRRLATQTAASSANLARGTTLPRNLREELAIKDAMSRPTAGKLVSLELKDTRWPSSNGWVKMQQIIDSGGREGPITVHYVRNVRTGAVDDFKIVIKATKRGRE